MNQVDWSKAPEGATHWEFRRGQVPESWMKLSEGYWYWFYTSRGAWVTAGPRKDDDIAAMIPRPQAWTGIGLPPVGTVCEIWYSCNEWAPCTVMVHDISMGIPIAVVKHGDQCYTGSSAKTLRPIRTPEQIAAEAREKAIAEMWAVYWKPEVYTAQEGLGLLYDAGYRLTKQDGE